MVLYREEQSPARSTWVWLILALQIIPLLIVVVGVQTGDVEAPGAAVAAFVIIGLLARARRRANCSVQGIAAHRGRWPRAVRY